MSAFLYTVPMDTWASVEHNVYLSTHWHIAYQNDMMQIIAILADFEWKLDVLMDFHYTASVTVMHTAL